MCFVHDTSGMHSRIACKKKSRETKTARTDVIGEIKTISERDRVNEIQNPQSEARKRELFVFEKMTIWKSSQRSRRNRRYNSSEIMITAKRYFIWRKNFRVCREEITWRYFCEDCCCCCFTPNLRENCLAMLYCGDCCAMRGLIVEVYLLPRIGTKRSRFSCAWTQSWRECSNRVRVKKKKN